jgi:two-component system cell cycle response regulator
MNQDPCPEKRYSVLVVEDHPATRRLLEMQLSKAGYRVKSAGNGREALALLAADPCPLVLTDWMMPEMDGVELCRALRAQEGQGYVYLILLTGRDGLDDVVQGLEAGADDYLTKPVHPAELMARLKTGRRILELEHHLQEKNREIARLAVTDALTGLYNRRYLTEKLPLELKRAARYHHPLSVILCDIDHFKRVNDTFGHQVGDEVLKEFARRLTGATRKGVDWAARYGGEEFLLVLPETDLHGSLAVAERLRRLMAHQTMTSSAGEITCTASFGVASWEGERAGDASDAAARLLQEADRCLYSAKEAGRNRVAGLLLAPAPPDADCALR